MAASLRDRARMSTGGGTTERETAQVFAGYDHEEELLAGGAGAAGDLARLSESLQEKEVAATGYDDERCPRRGSGAERESG